MATYLAALLVIGLAVYDFVSPIRAGSLGFANVGWPVMKVTSVVSGGPAESVGMVPGDVVRYDRVPLGDRAAWQYRRSGQTVQVPVVHYGRGAVVPVVAADDAAARWRAQDIAPLVIATVFGLSAILLRSRSRDPNECGAAATFFVLAAASLALDALVDVAPEWRIAAGADAAATLAGALAVVALLRLAAATLFEEGRARRWFERTAWPAGIAWLLLVAWTKGGAIFIDASARARFGFPVDQLAADGLDFLVSIAVVIGALAALRAGVERRRTKLRWIVLGLGVSCGLEATADCYAMLALFGSVVMPLWSAWLPIAASVPLLALAYALVARRLVDPLRVLARGVSVAVALVTIAALFYGTFWLVAKYTPGVEWLRFAAAALVGVCAPLVVRRIVRWIDALADGRRLRAVAELHRFATVSDVVSDPRELLALACEHVVVGLGARFAAMYVAGDEDYRCAYAQGASMPPYLGEIDPVVRRSRRRNAPFWWNDEHPIFEDTLVCPFSVRGEPAGFLCCSFRRANTHHSGDEFAALSHVAASVGSTYLWILQERTIAELRTGRPHLAAPLL
ncbi:MAG: hypothetical protein JOZ38_02615 [Candidatus Eremiobacteraeota bacterium]|nr:hypothetical protein [Candidatus Eremiobacteraeota bacterium]